MKKNSDKSKEFGKSHWKLKAASVFRCENFPFTLFWFHCNAKREPCCLQEVSLKSVLYIRQILSNDASRQVLKWTLRGCLRWMPDHYQYQCQQIEDQNTIPLGHVFAHPIFWKWMLIICPYVEVPNELLPIASILI